MYFFDFNAKLKQLNARLYTNIENVTRTSPGVFSTGIYLKAGKRDKGADKVNTNYAEGSARELLRALQEGSRDTYLMGVSTNFVPEYDVYDLDRGKILMPGWRDIVLRLVKKEVCTLERARKVFNRRSLGESDWDRLSFPQRFQWAKGDRPKREFK